MRQPKGPTQRQVALTRTKVAGFEGDSRTFTRLVVESRVNRRAMNEAWAAGVALRSARADEELQALYELDVIAANGQRLGTDERAEAVEQAADRMRARLVLAPAMRDVTDELCARWIDGAPRFGAVAAHFPESLRKRRFVAGFWAPEVFFGDTQALWPGTRGWYQAGGTRPMLDSLLSRHLLALPGLRVADRSSFWSPELPEVVEVTPDGRWWRGSLGTYWTGHRAGVVVAWRKEVRR